MSKFIDPEIVLESLKKITVELYLLYEQSEEANTISHVTTDLFGNHVQNYKLPNHFHYLQPEVVKVMFGTRLNGTTLSIIQLEHLLEKVQQQIIKVCNRKTYLDLLIAYLNRLDFIIDTIINSQAISVFTINFEALELAGYHPDLINSKENEYKKQLSKEIRNHFIEPLKRWLKHLLESVNHSKSLGAAKKVIKEFSKINADHKLERSSRVDNSYTILKSQNRKFLPELYERLVDGGFIARETKENDFYAIFDGSPIITKIKWVGKIGDFVWFVHSITGGKIIHKLGAPHVTTALIFDIKDKDVFKVLKGGKETNPSYSRKEIEKVLKKFNYSLG